MPESRTINISEAVKKDNGWYEATDALTDDKFSTKKSAIGDQVLALRGKRAVVEFTVKTNGDFTNRYIDSIAEAEGTNGDIPVAGMGNYIKGKTNPDDEKAINARRAIQDAVAAMTHTIPSGATPKDAWDKIGPLYQKIKLELNLESGLKQPGPDYDADIPF